MGLDPTETDPNTWPTAQLTVQATSRVTWREKKTIDWTIYPVGSDLKD